MANAVESEMSDVDWLVMRARSFPRSDPYSAKAWLITAKSLFPQSFVIQFESYLAEKAAKNINEAARHLQDMLQSFPQEQRLWDEVHSIMDSLQKDASDQRVNFLTDLFAAIPTSIQCQMLLKVSEAISDVLERCKLLLLAMEKFPNLVQEHGLKLVEMLVKEETNSGIVNNPVNRYRKLLVCDVMPLVLQKIGHLDVNIFHLYIWLQRAVEFYISYVSQPPSEGSGDENQGVKANRGLAGLTDVGMQVSDPWGNLFKFLFLIGERLKWDVERDLTSKSKDYQIQSLNHQLVRVKAGSAPETNSKQILYTAMVLFAYSFLNYVSFVDTESAHSGSSHQVPVVLLEGILKNKSDTASCSRPKKSKTENSSTPIIQPSQTITAPAVILHCFETAIMCMEILNSSEDMKFEFYNLCQNWQSQTQQLLALFQIDMNIYQGKYQDAMTVLQNPPISMENYSVKMKTRVSLQLACCHFCQKKYLKAAELALDIAENVSVSTSSPANGNSGDSDDRGVASRGRCMLLLQMTPLEIFPYCLQLIIAALREKVMTSQRTDSILAHLIILLQYDWPKQEALFAEVISVIQKQGSFTYNNFFSYVHLVDILEEFAFLDSLGVDDGKINLDIMPISTKALVQQRTVTRGVNKGVKEDFKAALEKQVGAIMDSTHLVIQRFLKEERAEILKNLTS